jgi:O-acetyl-ADP-ribose deacetylase (regulator of RNase III)
MKKILILITLFSTLAFAQHNLIKKISLSPKTSLILSKGDITQCNVQAIVNAANEQLLGGGGVCGAIFSAAGFDDLQGACNMYPAKQSIRCPVGQARITDSFNLKDNGIRYIIHAVGPDCRIIRDKQKQNHLLFQAYTNSLILADQNNIKTIAFPFISSAIYAFPKERAAYIALKSVSDYIDNNPTKLTELHFVLFSRADFDLFCSAIEQLESRLIN